MSNHALIAVSAVAHVCLLAGVFVSGVWRLERLDGERAPVRLTQPLSPPEAQAGGQASSRRPETLPKAPPLRTAKGTHQPPRRPDSPPPTPAASTVGSELAGPGQGSGSAAQASGCTEGCDPPQPATPVCGNATLEPGEQCDDGNLLGGDGCSSTCQREPPPQPAVVAPSALTALRVAGETQIHPGELTLTQMVHDEVHRVEAIVKLCITVDGSVGPSQLLRSTGYRAYDAALLAAVRGWRYEPYRVNGAPVPACSTVRFVYTIQ